MTTNAETLSRLEAANLDIPEETPLCVTCGEDPAEYGRHCGTCAQRFADDRDLEADSWELAVREERERLE